MGDGDTDHYCWQRPEDMTTSRQAYKVDRDHPGSDVAGETAAAMAAASIVFRDSNPHYAHLLLHHAQQVIKYSGGFCYDSFVGEKKTWAVEMWWTSGRTRPVRVPNFGLLRAPAGCCSLYSSQDVPDNGQLLGRGVWRCVLPCVLCVSVLKLLRGRHMPKL